MTWHPSDQRWVRRIHLPKVHAVHLHPVQWLTEHPLVMALLIAGLLVAMIIFLAAITDTGIRIETLHPFDYPA